MWRLEDPRQPTGGVVGEHIFMFMRNFAFGSLFSDENKSLLRLIKTIHGGGGGVCLPGPLSVNSITGLQIEGTNTPEIMSPWPFCRFPAPGEVVIETNRKSRGARTLI